MRRVGSLAPDFSLSDGSGNVVSLSDFKDQKHCVLYFYPKDDTTSCTLEATLFSEQKADYDALEAVILGVSKDSVASHKRFCLKYGLSITLLSDPDHKVIESYGAWQKRQFMGREFMGTVRSTYLIDKKGIISHVWPKVTPRGHELAVLHALQRL